MSVNINFKSWGDTDYDVRLTKAEYQNNKSICIPMIVEKSSDEDDYKGEDYGYLTVNTDDCGDKVVALDTNNSEYAVNAFMRHVQAGVSDDGTGAAVNPFGEIMASGECWGMHVGTSYSGYCAYPLVELNDDFIKSLEDYYTFDRTNMKGVTAFDAEKEEGVATKKLRALSEKQKGNLSKETDKQYE